MSSAAPHPLRVLLILGRVSNLPTVWSNCLAAWLLGGGGSGARFALLGGGASLLYTGGMFLNDVCDAGFDREYRTERPIPSGHISRAAAAWMAAAMLVSGWLLWLPLGLTTAALGLALLVLIVLYDLVHKHTPAAPWLMAGCRLVLYLAGGAAAHASLPPALIWPAGALAGYIAGLSFLARTESRPGAAARRPLALLLLPLALALATGGLLAPGALLALGALGLWLFRCVRRRNVSGLLAGIALVDWVAAAHQPPLAGLAFAGLFALALLLQRFAPAT